jgi:glutamate carboxypeptidase
VESSITADATEVAARAERDLEALVGVSSPSGDHDGAEEAIAICTALLPPEARIERITCSTAGNAPDLIARIAGDGERRVLLLGHLDTVVSHGAHAPMRRDGDRFYGAGTVDMKGGVALSLGIAHVLAARPESFAELSLLLVTDEEWRTSEFAHVARFPGYDACLCFEAGELTADGGEGVVVKRKAAGTLRIGAAGRASHSGSAPDQGRNALLALARASVSIAALHDPAGPERMSVVPTMIRAGEALNVVPPAGELVCDLRAERLEAFEAALAAVPDEIDGVRLTAGMDRRWPGMDARAATAPLLERASARLGRPVIGVPRGGASDASHFAATVPLTIDGLGPRGGGAHTPEEFVLQRSLRERAEVALAIVAEVLAG